MLRSAVQQCVRSTLLGGGGSDTNLKVLILDAQTTGIASLLFGQSDALQSRVFLIERIDVGGAGAASNASESQAQESRRHLSAVYFVRPTPDNLLHIVQELASPRFNNYSLFFTTRFGDSQLTRLARADIHKVVTEVQVVAVDVYVLGGSLFSLELPTLGLLPYQNDRFAWTPFEEALYQRVSDGLTSAAILFLSGTKGVARYNASAAVRIGFTADSDLCRRLATTLQTALLQEKTDLSGVSPAAASVLGGEEWGGGASHPAEGSGDKISTILIVDRRTDMLTPLLNQWTYRAMVHELLGIDCNRVRIPAKERTGDQNVRLPSGEIDEAEVEEFVLNDEIDPFYAQNACALFGELGEAIKNYVAELRKSTDGQGVGSSSSIEEMKRFMEKYPEYRKLSANVSKHVAIVHQLSRIVHSHELLETSPLEQKLASGGTPAPELVKNIMEKLETPGVPRFEKLRLVLLYAIKFCDMGVLTLPPDLPTLLRLAKSAGIDQHQLETVDALRCAAATLKTAAVVAARATATPDLPSDRKPQEGSDIEENDPLSVLTSSASPYISSYHPLGGIGSTNNFFQLAKDLVKRSLTRYIPSNVYCRHESLLAHLVHQYIKYLNNQLPPPPLPHPLRSLAFLNGSTTETTSSSSTGDVSAGFLQEGGSGMQRNHSILVFMVGGATYEEAGHLEKLATENECAIVLGGTTFHNSKSFLADLLQTHKAMTKLERSRRQQQLPTPSTASPAYFHRAQTPIPPRNTSAQERPLLAASNLSTHGDGDAPLSDRKREAELAKKQEFLRQKW